MFLVVALALAMFVLAHRLEASPARQASATAPRPTSVAAMAGRRGAGARRCRCQSMAADQHPPAGAGTTGAAPQRMLTHPTPRDGHASPTLREREFARLDAERRRLSRLRRQRALRAIAGRHAPRAAGADRVRQPAFRAAPALAASTAVIERRGARCSASSTRGDDYVVCFTANATAAIKLVAEAIRSGRHAACVLTADNHNSVNGVREYARRAGADGRYLPLRADLRLDHPEARLGADRSGGGLFAFPAQSNFSGVQHPLSLVATRAVARLSTSCSTPRRSCRATRSACARVRPISSCSRSTRCSAIRPASARWSRGGTRSAALARPWFSGGTVDYASVSLNRHRLRAMHEGFEDGTPDFLDIAALAPGFALRRTGCLRVSTILTEASRFPPCSDAWDATRRLARFAHRWEWPR